MMAKRVASRAIWKFGQFPDYSRDDLVQVGFMGARRACIDGKFDPNKGYITTFIYRAAWCDIQDLWRQVCRKRCNENTSARLPVDACGPREERTLLADLSGEETLCEWLTVIYDRLRRIRPIATVQEGRPSNWTPAQRAAMVLLQERVGLSCRGVSHLLATRADLRDAMELKIIPSYRFHHRLKKSVTKLTRLRKSLDVPLPTPIDRSQLVALHSE